MIDTTHIDLLSFVGRDTQLKRKGQEYHGACPFCRAGVDRFWVNPATNRWYCRQCDIRGGDVITYVMRRDGCDFRTAVQSLGLSLKTAHRQATPMIPTIKSAGEYPALSNPDWRQSARDFAARCEDILHSADGTRAMGYLKNNRLLDEWSIDGAGLGYNPTECRDTWGGVSVWLPRGITIPWFIAGELSTVRIRVPVPANGNKYIQPKGAANGLYRGQTVMPSYPVVLVEGEFDALLIAQVARDNGLQIATVATGSIHGARRPEWLVRLALASQVYVAFDSESEPDKLRTVESAASYWLNALERSQRLLPTRHDITDMALAGDSIGLWLANALKLKASVA